MYKILIIASTENILNHKNKFSKNGAAFDYLISEKNSRYNFGQFNQQNMNCNDLMLPINHHKNSENITAAKLQARNQISHELKQLEAIVTNYSDKIEVQNQMTVLNMQSPISDQVLYFDQIIDLKINNLDNRIHLEITNSQVLEYDHIYIEESYLLFSKLDKKIKFKSLIHFDDQNIFQFVGTSFQTGSDFVAEPFWLLTDSNYKSVYDNIHFIKPSTESEKKCIDVWSWLPVQQISNPEQVIYLQARLQKRLQTKFNFLNFTAIPAGQFLSQPMNTWMNIKNKSPNLISCISGFHFQSELQIEKLIQAVNDTFFKKMKTKRENIQKINIEANL